MLFGTILLDELHHRHLPIPVVDSGAPVARLVFFPHEAVAFPQLGAALETGPDEGFVGLPGSAVVTPGHSGTVLGRHFGGSFVVFVVIVGLMKRELWLKEPSLRYQVVQECLKVMIVVRRPSV